MEAPLKKLVVIEDAGHGGSHAGRVLGVNEHSGIPEHFRQGAAVRGHDRHARGHGLEHRDAKTLLE
ncbi:hypothetical protein D3C83_207920 [compost metagenome]